MNSFYGVMGTEGCRFHDHRLPAAITGTGQWVLKLTRKHFEQHGYEVLYGDTDSVFVKLKRGEWLDVEKATSKLVQRINTFIADTIRTEFGLDSHLEIEFERHFIRFFLPALRGGGEGAKKRYVGMVANLNKGRKRELMFTGLEFVRSDWTRFAKNFSMNCLTGFFMTRKWRSGSKGLSSDLRNHVYDIDLIYQKRLRKPLEEYVKIVPPHVKAALCWAPKPKG